MKIDGDRDEKYVVYFIFALYIPCVLWNYVSADPYPWFEVWLVTGGVYIPIVIFYLSGKNGRWVLGWVPIYILSIVIYYYIQFP